VIDAIDGRHWSVGVRDTTRRDFTMHGLGRGVHGDDFFRRLKWECDFNAHRLAPRFRGVGLFRGRPAARSC